MNYPQSLHDFILYWYQLNLFQLIQCAPQVNISCRSHLYVQLWAVALFTCAAPTIWNDLSHSIFILPLRHFFPVTPPPCTWTIGRTRTPYEEETKRSFNPQIHSSGVFINKCSWLSDHYFYNTSYRYFLSISNLTIIIIIIE